MHPLAPSAASRARSYSALANTSHDGGGGAGIAFGGPAGDVFSSPSAASCAAALDPALVSVAGIGSPMRTAAGWMPSEYPQLPPPSPPSPFEKHSDSPPVSTIEHTRRHP